MDPNAVVTALIMTLIAILLVVVGYRLRDRSAKKEIGAARRDATTDYLTDLTNRAGLMHHLDRMYGAQRSYALLLFDLDGFKPVNDTYGHRIGDMLLQRVADAVRKVQRMPGMQDCLPARLGGDEFVVVVPIDEPANGFEVQRLDHYLRLFADLVKRSVSVSLRVNDDEVRVGASVGMVRADPSCNPRDVMHAADQAMYDAKQTSGVTFRVDVAVEPVTSDAPAKRLRDVRQERRRMSH